MAGKDIKHIVSRFEQLQAQRQNYEKTWDDITEFVLPHRGDFQHKRAAAQRKTRRLYDTTAIQSNEFLASTLHGGLTNPAVKWFQLRSLNPEIAQLDPVKQYLQIATDAIFDVVNSPASNFQSQNHELFLDLTAYGTACMYIEDLEAEGIRFKAVHLSELFIAEDMSGNIDTVFRKFEYTARQAAQFWGLDALSAPMRKAAEKTPDKKFKILHCVKPNEDYDSESRLSAKMKYSSMYIDLDTMHLISTGGYSEQPYLVPRWAKLVGETYGRSPAWSALADIYMINIMSKTIVVGSEKMVDPPLLMSDDGVMLPLNTKPGGINYGGIDIDGRPKIQPLNTQARLDIGLQLVDQRKQAIRNAYFIDPLLFREGPQMTATEVMQRQEEKLRLIGPQIGRIQTEYLNPLISRIYGLLQRSNRLPELPEEIADLVEAGGLEIEYTAPLVKTQRSQEPAALQRTLEVMLPLAQADPTILDNIDPDSAFRVVADIYGVPYSILRPLAAVEQLRAERAQQEQAMMQQQQAQQVASSAADLAKAGLIPTEGQ